MNLNNALLTTDKMPYAPDKLRGNVVGILNWGFEAQHLATLKAVRKLFTDSLHQCSIGRAFWYTRDTLDAAIKELE